MRGDHHSCAIAVMAKAPQAGRSKTRLIPPLDPDGAAALSAAFLRDITDNIARAGLAGCVAYAPAGQEALFDGLLAPGASLLLADGLLADGSPPMPARVRGFGRSLLHAMRSAFALGHGAVCLLNADSPTLPTELLRRAAAALSAPGDRVVLGPAEDGGYYLIGAKAAHAHLFEDIDWSTEQVADQTRARVRALGLDCVELPRWYDVDDRGALFRLLADLETPSGGALTPYPAPATLDCVRRLSLAALLTADA